MLWPEWRIVKASDIRFPQPQLFGLYLFLQVHRQYPDTEHNYGIGDLVIIVDLYFLFY